MASHELPPYARAAQGEPARSRAVRRGPTSSRMAAEPDHQRATQAHVQDLSRICQTYATSSSVALWARRNIVLAFVSFLASSAWAYLWTLLVSPASIFFDPLSTIATLVLYPIIGVGLAVLVALLYLFSLLGGGRLVDWISFKYAGGLGVVNWLNPDIFGERSLASFIEARPTLEGAVETTIVQEVPLDVPNPDFTSLKTIRVFSLPLARVFLLMSSLVYERNDALLDQAAYVIIEAQKHFPLDSPQYKDAMSRAEALIVDSERVIKTKAAEWGLEFDGVSDLGTIGGPFAGIFYAPPTAAKPFICLVFKGTTPTRFQEFLTDATINKTGASVFFGPGSGSVHAGFYSNLFVTNDARRAGGDGYGSIVRTLRHVAQRMKQGSGSGDRIPLWVAGHSLGSALASLCFARFLRSTDDLGVDLVLRDAYCYGTPRVGDGAFASAFEQTLVTPLDRKNILWRVRNHRDFVTTIPPGLGDNESGRTALSSASVLNFAWLSAAVHLRPARFPYRPPFYTLERLGAFHEAVEVQVVEARGDAGGRANPLSGLAEGEKPDPLQTPARGLNPLVLAMSLLPTPLYNHMPASYLDQLDRVWTTAQQQAAERLAAEPSQRGQGLEAVESTYERLQEVRRRARRAAAA